MSTALPDFQRLVAESTGRRAAPEPDAPADARILDATLRVVAEYGERRLTMDDVAAAAKVGRATVFRRFGSKDVLLGRLYAREVRRAIAAARAAADGAPDATAALGATLHALTEHVSGHPVIVRLARAEPEVLVEQWRSGRPSGLDLIVAVLSATAEDRDAAVDRTRLRSLCDVLARLLFAELLLPGAGGPARARLVDDVLAAGLLSPPAALAR